MKKIMVLWLFIATLGVCIIACACKEMNKPKVTNKKDNVVETVTSHDQHKPGCSKYRFRYGWGIKPNGRYGYGLTYGPTRDHCSCSDEYKIHSNVNLK